MTTNPGLSVSDTMPKPARAQRKRGAIPANMWMTFWLTPKERAHMNRCVEQSGQGLSGWLEQTLQEHLESIELHGIFFADYVDKTPADGLKINCRITQDQHNQLTGYVSATIVPIQHIVRYAVLERLNKV